MARAVGDGCSNRADITACFTAKTARTQKGLPGNEGHQGQDVSSTTRRQPKSCRAHISTPPPTTIQPRPRPASTQPRISAPPGGTSHTTPTPTSASTKPTRPKSPPSTKTRRLRRSALSRSHSHDHRRVQRRLRHETAKEDHYRSVNHVAITGPIVQTKWSHVPLTFDARDVDLRSTPHIDAMVVKCSVAGWDLHKVFVDNGS
jgi:hypothetical protein